MDKSIKEQAIEAIGQLPETASWEDVQEKVRSRAAAQNRATRSFSMGKAPDEELLSDDVRLWLYFITPAALIALIVVVGYVVVKFYDRAPGSAQQTEAVSYFREDGSVDPEKFIGAYLSERGLELAGAEGLGLQFRGSFDAMGERVGFSGTSDLMGNGDLRILDWSSDQTEFSFMRGELESGLDELEAQGREAIAVIASFFKDPLLAYALNPGAFSVDFKPDVWGVMVELGSFEHDERFSILVHSDTLQIRSVHQVGASGEMKLQCT